MRRTLALLALTVAAGTATAQEFRWLNPWDRNHFAVPNLAEPYVKAVEAASKGSIKFVVSGPETVPPFEQLQPVIAGAFQFLLTHGSYHFGTSPLLTAFEALGGTPEQRYNSGVIEWIDQQYQKLGVKLIGIPMTPEGGYHIVLRQPVSAAGDLAGRKIRGTPSFAGVVKMLGASSVILPPAEVYTALEKGVVDGAAWPVLGTSNFRWHEVAKFKMRPGFGFGTNPIFVNLATWNKLSDAQRKVLTDEMRKLERSWLEAGKRETEIEEKALESKGMQTTMLPDAQRAKLHQAWADGLWETAAQKDRKLVEEMRALAKSKGL